MWSKRELKIPRAQEARLSTVSTAGAPLYDGQGGLGVQVDRPVSTRWARISLAFSHLLSSFNFLKLRSNEHTKMPHPRIDEVGEDFADLFEEQKRVNAHFQSAAVYWKEIYQLEDVYATIHRERRTMVLEFVDQLALPPNSHVLEIGCGAGLTTVALAQKGYLVDAVDTVEAMLDLTRRAAAEAGLENWVKTSAADAHQLALRSGSFDLVLAIGVVPWLHALPKAMQEMARVIRPGGYLIVNSDNRWRLNHLLDPLRFPAMKSTRARVRRILQRFGLRQLPARSHGYSLKEFDSFLARVGFDIVRSRTLGFGPFSFFNHELLPASIGVRIHRKLQKLADQNYPVIRSTAAQYLVLARKSDAG